MFFANSALALTLHRRWACQSHLLPTASGALQGAAIGAERRAAAGADPIRM
jgi:hypothetical protein